MKSLFLKCRRSLVGKLSTLVLFAIVGSSPFASAKELAELRVVYVGSERANEFVDFLRQHVADVHSVDRDEFNPADGDKFDVVLLDWPQSSDARLTRTQSSPLGPRENWSRPTVLLGSAGLNLACAWQLRGGSGCTCLDPVAYDLKNHVIFKSPFAIDRAATTAIDTPSSFQDDLEAKSIDVIPLVDDHEKHWRAGWCTYSTAFEVFPEVEFFCGGVNHKTPTAAAIWRQGNLMHFGFQQSPVELNDVGDKMLLNAIAYISHFSQDRPIAITPSVFVGPYTRPRSSVASYLANPDRAKWVERMVTPELWATMQNLDDTDAMAAWAKERTPYFTPDAASKLEIDKDLETIKMGFDDPGFLPSMIEHLASNEQGDSARAKRLLLRYVPEGPKSDDANTWNLWYDQNEPFLFATDYGHYRWYIDPLAKQRGVATAQLRGTARMDQ
ncbi:hypothetical protein [Novipirellula rosea]|uniref:Uncharacterized protein n=1 Tax=Novipirellula rosea TaxID=1031540 RepID=A0ABP8MTA6_9BACT